MALALSVCAPVFAEPNTDSLSGARKQLQVDRDMLNQAKDKREALEQKVEKLDDQIQNIMIQINDTKKKIASTEKEMDKVSKEIQKAEEDIKDEQELFNDRMRVMYMKGTNAYIDFIFESEGLGDLISRMETVKNIIKYDKKVIGDLKDKKEVIQKKKDELAQEKQKLVSLKASNEKKADELNKAKEEQLKLVAEAKKEQDAYESKVASQVKSIEDRLKQLRETMTPSKKPTVSRGDEGDNSGTVSTGTSSVTGERIVAYASNFIGRPYKWGGNGPDSFDCSGFTCYVFARYGISLERTSSAQATQGTYVPRSQLQPGDLVFFGQGSIHHVGIYVGGNCYIHAPRTGDYVKISPLTRSDYATARRVR